MQALTPLLPHSLSTYPPNFIPWPRQPLILCPEIQHRNDKFYTPTAPLQFSFSLAASFTGSLEALAFCP